MTEIIPASALTADDRDKLDLSVIFCDELHRIANGERGPLTQTYALALAELIDDLRGIIHRVDTAVVTS